MSITRARDESRTGLVKTYIFLFCIFISLVHIYWRRWPQDLIDSAGVPPSLSHKPCSLID